MRAVRSIILSVILLAALAAAERACAQYYSWGADPARFRWMRAETLGADVIYPDHTPEIGLSTLRLVERMRPYISYGYRLPALDIPFVVHPENMRSNGLVMWLPKRVEFLSAPAVDGYSMPWIKQLVAHEYRHAVQYNNLNVGFVKFLSRLLGQQSSTIGLLYMPLWMIEGDATMSETQASSFGRGKQPRFTLEFRAMGDIATKYRNTDKFFCGSYRDFIPDHYQLGYQLVSYGNETTGRVICDEIAAYGPRHPWMVISTGLTMRKLFGFTTRDLFRRTFGSLADYWASLPAAENSATFLPAPRRRSYTKYSDPIHVAGDTLLLLKEDFDDPSRFVLLDAATGEERTLCHTGEVSTRPVYDRASGRVWWTEYRRSKMFAEKVESRICYFDLGENRPRTVAMRGNLLYPTPDGEGGMAWTEYAPDGIYTVVRRSRDGSESHCALPFGQEVHSLAWDDLTRRIYMILTGDEGMWIARIDPDGAARQVTHPAYITLSSLRARGGTLYFGSIASGRDETHCYDLREGKEYRISESTYGSFDPAPTDDGRVAMTTYDSLGYRPSIQSLREGLRPVEYSKLPLDIVNPPRRSWNTINLDTVALNAADTAASADAPRRVRRYRKGQHLFNFHSWAPLSYDPFSLGEGAVNLNFGATVMTQNLLSTMQGFFTYGWSGGDGSVWRGSLRYHGLGPTLSVNATYGGRQNIYPVYAYNPETHAIEFPEAPERGKYYSVGASVSFPLMFQRGYHTRYLTASASWEYSNGLVANTGKLSIGEGGISNVATIGYSKGLHLTSFAVGFQDMTRMSHRDFLPPWGFAVSASYAVNPADGRFSDLAALFARIYTPGVLPHNSFNLDVAYQTSIGGFRSRDALSALTFKSTRLLPRGFDSTQIENRHYMAASLNYRFPICYPDGGWRGIVYFKRIRANMGYDIARFRRREFVAGGMLRERWHKIDSWGGDLTFDVNLLSQPASATVAITLSLYRPSEGGVYFSAGMDLPF